MNPVKYLLFPEEEAGGKRKKVDSHLPFLFPFNRV